MPFLSVLTSKPAALIADIAVLILLVVAGALWLTNHSLDARLTTATNSIGQLKGSLDFQNLQVSQLGKASAAAKKQAQAAVAAATAAHAGDDARVAAILAAPVPSDPAQACEAADQSIREFFK